MSALSLYHGKRQRKSAVASGSTVLHVAWLRTEMEGHRIQDGGGSAGPQGPLLEMMQGLRGSAWACYIWRSIFTSGKDQPGHFFFLLSLTLKHMKKLYLWICSGIDTIQTSVYAQAQTHFGEKRPTFSP